MFCRVRGIWVHVFKDPGFSWSESGVRVQVLQVALCIYMEITLRHRCYPVNFAAYFRTSFYKNTFEGLPLYVWTLISLLLYYFTHFAYHVNFHILPLTDPSATGRYSAKMLYCIFTQKVLEEVQVLVVLYVVSLQIY